MTVNKTLLEPFKETHGRVNCLEMTMTDTPQHPVCSRVPAVGLLPTLWKPTELGTFLRKEHLSSCS